MAKQKHISTRVSAVVNGVKASIKVLDYIGGEQNDSASVRAVVADAIARGAVEADVYINSRGGSVFEATEMVNELKKFGKVTIRVGALAASAATYITSSFHTVAASNSQLMIHKPSLGTYGNVEQIKADMKLLENLTADYLNVYAQKTGKESTAIAEMWKDGDYWMTANEALSLGFIDAIEDTGELITEGEAALLEAAGAPVIPETNKHSKNRKMERVEIIAALGLAADATDVQIQAALKDAKRKAEAYEAEKANTENLKKLRAEALVSRAINGKKILATQKDQYEKLAIADYDSVATILEAAVTIPQLSAEIKGGAAGVDAKAGWTIQDYLDKDPEALQQLAKENPEAYAELEAAY